jgi:hypothetical protein
MLASMLLAVAAPVATAIKPAGTHCLDSFLAVGQPIARQIDVVEGKVTNPKPDYVIRIDLLVAPDRPMAPLIGFLYITREENVFFSTRERAAIDPGAKPLIREIFAASTTATSSELDTLLAKQNGNAVVYLPRALRTLRSLNLKAASCAILAKDSKKP